MFFGDFLFVAVFASFFLPQNQIKKKKQNKTRLTEILATATESRDTKPETDDCQTGCRILSHLPHKCCLQSGCTNSSHCTPSLCTPSSPPKPCNTPFLLLLLLFCGRFVGCFLVLLCLSFLPLPLSNCSSSSSSSSSVFHKPSRVSSSSCVLPSVCCCSCSCVVGEVRWESLLFLFLSLFIFLSHLHSFYVCPGLEVRSELECLGTDLFCPSALKVVVNVKQKKH